jgi:hypothetical protein
MISLYAPGLFDELSKIAGSQNVINQLEKIKAVGKAGAGKATDAQRYATNRLSARWFGHDARSWIGDKSKSLRSVGVRDAVYGGEAKARARKILNRAQTSATERLGIYRKNGPPLPIPGPKPPEPKMGFVDRVTAGMHNEKLKQTRSKVMSQGGYARDLKRSADSPKNLYRKLPKEE